MEQSAAKNLYIGTSGWSYEDWKGSVYSAAEHRDALSFMSRYFDALEINVSFYRSLPSRMTESWLRKTESCDRFLFTAKLYQRFTHQRDRALDDTEVRQWTEGLEPLRQAGRLGAVLAQFPWSFRFGPESAEWLRAVCDRFSRYPLVVELRHDSWLAEEGLELLRSLNVGFCNIDQPRHRHCIGPTDLALSPVGYIRLHGRNHARWFNHDTASQRYDYLYTQKELAEWVPRIERVAGRTEKTFVFANNHFQGQAVANALQLRAMLGGGQVDVPELLLRTYGELARIARRPLRQRQKRLF